MKYLIGLDLGSGSIRAGAFDLQGHAVALASRPTVSKVPDDTKPDHIVWPHQTVWSLACSVLREVRGMLDADAEIAGVAAACLGMDGLPLDEKCIPLYDFIAWIDGRCTPYYEAWCRKFGEDRQFLTTGTPPRTFSTLFRLQWMADHHPEILEKTHKWVLMGDYINFHLCGTLAVDHSMAACTLLFDPRTGDWHREIVSASGIDTRLMCDPKPSGTVLGTVSTRAAEETGLPAGTPVVLGGHDYLCGVLPVGGHKPGAVVNIGGTWDIIQATLPNYALPEAAAGTGWTVEPHVAPGEFSAFGAAIGGAVTSWFRQAFAPELSDDAYFELASAAASSKPGSAFFLPHLAGATGPVVDMSAAGAFFGLRSECTRKEILGAVLEGLNFQTREILNSIEIFGVTPDRVAFVGGSSKNPTLVQNKANALGLPVEVPEISETTVLGAAIIAGAGAGVFASTNEAVEAMRPTTTVVEPDSNKGELVETRFGVYRRGFEALRGIEPQLREN